MSLRKFALLFLLMLFTSSVMPLGYYLGPVTAAPQDISGTLISYVPSTAEPQYSNLLNVFVRQGVKWIIFYSYPTSSQITQAKNLGIKTLIYVTGLKEPASVISSGIGLWPGGPTVFPQQNWAQYDVDINGNPTSASKYLYPADVGTPSEVYFSPYGPYVDQVVLPRANRAIELGADGVFLDTLFLFWDSPATKQRYGGGESSSRTVWQTRYSSLSFLDFRYRATHDVAERIRNTIAGRGILIVSNNGIQSEADRRGFASSIDQWNDAADGFVLEYLSANGVPPDPPDIVTYTWILFWKYVMGVNKPIWQLYFTNIDWQFKYMTNAAMKIPCGYWAYLEYIQQIDSSTGQKKRSVLTLDLTGSGSVGSVKLEGYLQNAFTGAGIAGKTVHLKYALEKLPQPANYLFLADVTTDSNGYYSYTWVPSGRPYNITAYWDGDSNYNPWRVYDAAYLAQAKQEPPFVNPDPVYWVYNFRRYPIQGGIGGAVFNSYGLSSSKVRVDTWDAPRSWPEQWASYPLQVGGTYHRILPEGYTLDGSQPLPPEAGLAPPSAPTSLSATMLSSSSIALSWSYSGSTYDNFRIERKTGAGGTYSEIATVPAGTTTYQSTGLAAATTYYYRVRAYRISDNEYSSYSNQASATTDVVPPMDFSLSSSGGITASQGSSGSNTITVSYILGTRQSVSLSVSGLPTGASSIFNPSSGTPTFSSTLTVTASSSTAAGRYTVTVTGTSGSVTRATQFTLTVQPRITVPSSSLASNPLGRVFFIFNNKKYYVTSSAAFSSYGLNWADVKPYTVLNPDNYQSSQIYYDYLLDGKMPLPNRPYIAGDVNDGSLYYIPYYTWNGEKYPISGAGYNGYGGHLKTLPIRYGDPAMSLPTSSTVLDGVNPIPSVTPPGYTIGKNPLNRVFFIFNNQKYYFTDWNVYLGYGFTNADINPSVNPDNYPSAQVSFDYLLEETSSIFRKPLPNQPYIVGNVNDGSLYWVPFYTWTGEKYSITGTGYNSYGGQLKTLHTRFGDPSINLQTSTYVLDGINPIPQLTS